MKERATQKRDAHEELDTSAGKGAMPLRAREKAHRGIGKNRGRLEAGIERGAEFVWRGLRKRPMLGVAMVTGAGFVVADLVGVGELAFAAALGYGAYQVLKKNKPPAEALRDAMTIEREL